MDETSEVEKAKEDEIKHEGDENDHSTDVANGSCGTEAKSDVKNADTNLIRTANHDNADSQSKDETFKKPHLIGSKGQAFKLAKPVSETLDVKKSKIIDNKSSSQPQVAIPYTEPSWSGINRDLYKFEVLKSGVIIETIDLSQKPYFVFGRQSNCDFQLAHPTISRHHAVLQHRAESDESVESQGSACRDAGLYIYDMGSTHGTFVNKMLIPKQKYIRLRVGHLIKFGGSTRSYILIGPDVDVEKESEKSVTELREEARSKKNEKIASEENTSSEEAEKEDQGIDWGLGEDADEESDLSENPFAATQNEDLYLDDPKKSLRGWFEREGEELEYQVEEKGFGQFLCQVKLPVDDPHGRPLIAEALVKGKKKEAVVQCALEACRILDRMGLLRQANHESKKRKARNWEDNDFYDSDEDTFLDRTGTVEMKREKRMRTAGKLEVKAENYESLLKKHAELLEKMKATEEIINMEKSRHSEKSKTTSTGADEDALDAFMSTLSQKASLDKVDVRRLKVNLAKLREEEVHIKKLISIACPTNLPEILKPQDKLAEKTVEEKDSKEETSSTREQENPETGMKDMCLLEETEKTNTREESYNVKLKEGMKKLSPDKLPEKTRFDQLEEISEKPETSTVASDSIEEAEEPNKIISKVHGPRFIPECAKSQDDADLLHSEIKSTSKKNKARESDKKDELHPNYSMWVPPENQTGDGKTALNKKYGY